VYFIAAYWATMTLTSVGYGDIVPQNEMEYLVCILCMITSGFIWAYIVGSIVTILSNLDPHAVTFKQNIDDLNQLMECRGLPQELRVRIRTYMQRSSEFTRISSQRQLLENFVSRGLQREVVAKCPEVFAMLDGVFWVDGLEEPAILEIVRALQPNSFAPNEIMNLPDTMIVMHKGIAGVKGRVLARGEVWGASDILLDTPQLKEGAMPRSISYVEIFVLTRRSLLDVARCFPAADRRLRRAQIRTAMFRAFIRAAQKKKRASDRIMRTGGRLANNRSCSAVSLASQGSSGPGGVDAVHDSFGVGSFVHPGMNWFELGAHGARQGEENGVDLPELKVLILKIMHKQDAMAKNLHAVESRLDDFCVEQRKHSNSDATSSKAISAFKNTGQKAPWKFSR
jgi:hypothetical protein